MLRTIAENYPNSYLSIIEKDLTVGFTSGQEFKKQNLDRDQFTGLTLEQVFGDQTPLVREYYLKTFAGKEQSFELYTNEQYQLYRTVPLYALDGTIPRILSVAENITARKEAEVILKENEERLNLALSAANQGLYDLNVQTGETKVNDQYALMLGYDPREFHETNAAWIERLHPDERELVARTYKDYISGKIPEYRVEFRQRTKAGDWKWILSLGKILRWDQQGNPVRMLGTHTDITNRKRAEEELRTTQEFLTSLLENAPAAIYVVSEENEFRLVNRTWEAAKAATT